MAVSTMKFGNDLVIALGLQGQNVKKIVITAEAEHVPTVEVTTEVWGMEQEEVLDLITQYELTEKETDDGKV